MYEVKLTLKWTVTFHGRLPPRPKRSKSTPTGRCLQTAREGGEGREREGCRERERERERGREGEREIHVKLKQYKTTVYHITRFIDVHVHVVV